MSTPFHCFVGFYTLTNLFYSLNMQGENISYSSYQFIPSCLFISNLRVQILLQEMVALTSQFATHILEVSFLSFGWVFGNEIEQI